MRLAIHHVTEYRLERPARFVLQQARMSPRADPCQAPSSWRLSLEGGSLEAVFDDHHGNRIHLFGREGPGEVLRLVAEGAVETTDRAGVWGPHKGLAPLWLYLRSSRLTAPGDGVAALAASIAPAGDLDRLHALNVAVADQVRYEKGATDVVTTAEEALAAGRGVCQDQTHVFIACARRLGFPARYVSGYLWTEDPLAREASHAWAEAHVEGLGWVGFDPANRQSPDARYVRLAHGADYAEAAPVKGLRMGDGGAERLAVMVQIQQQAASGA